MNQPSIPQEKHGPEGTMLVSDARASEDQAPKAAALKYEATGPHGWTMTTVIDGEQAHDVVTVGTGTDAVMYSYGLRHVTGPEMRLLTMAREATRQTVTG